MGNTNLTESYICGNTTATGDKVFFEFLKCISEQKDPEIRNTAGTVLRKKLSRKELAELDEIISGKYSKNAALTAYWEEVHKKNPSLSELFGKIGGIFKRK